MERLPDEATLLHRLRHNEVGPTLVRTLAQRIALFHEQAEAGEHVAAFGRFAIVARNSRENLDQVVPQVGVTLSRVVYERLRALTEDLLNRLQPLIEARAKQGIPRDTHGDLHLDHVYLFPERLPPRDLLIIDCIEFNERFRFADPVADMAFLVMDFLFNGRRDLAEVFADAYFECSKDQEGRSLLSFYTAYRAAVRGKVEGFELAEQEISQAERAAALVKARAHWLLALGQLENPRQKPCLILIGGLPGTGKSTLARRLAERADCCTIRSDLVRKELAGITAKAHSAFGEGIYTSAHTDRTYAECLQRAERLLFEGERVIVDATFGEERRRQHFLDLAARLAVPAVFVVCLADRQIVRRRLGERLDDASDADWTIYREAAKRWEEFGPAARQVLREVSTNEAVEQPLLQVLDVLGERCLLE
jgi:aminoglycoside phosphotransferase family enzyme/predicted kinase